MKREDRVWLAVAIVVAGFVASVMFHYHQGFHLGNPYPRSTFLFLPGDTGMDYYNILRATSGFDPYASRLAVYFPFTYVPVMLLGLLPPAIGHHLLLVGFVGIAIWFVARQLDFLSPYPRFAASIALTLPSYPVLFNLDRGNVEMLVFALLCGFFLALKRGRYQGAAFWLACATAMKLYPGVFAVIFLRKRQYKAFAASILYTVILTLGSASLYRGGIAGSLSGLGRNLAWFKEAYMLSADGVRFNSSWFGAARIFAALYTESAPDPAGYTLYYTIFCLVIFAGLAWLIVRREMPLWQQTVLLTFAMILFPEVSFDYKLIHCLFPFALYLRAEETSLNDRAYVVLFASLMIPKAYAWIIGDVNIGTFVNPAAMSALMLAVVVTAMRRPRSGSGPESELSMNQG